MPNSSSCDQASQTKPRPVRYLFCRSQKLPPTDPKTLAPFRLTLTLPVDNFISSGGVDKTEYEVHLFHPESFHFLEWDIRLLVNVIGPEDKRYLGLVLRCHNPNDKDTEWKCTVDHVMTLGKIDARWGEKDNNFGLYCGDRAEGLTFSSNKNESDTQLLMEFSKLLNEKKELVRRNRILLTLDVYPDTIVGVHHHDAKMQLVEKREGAKGKVLRFLKSGQGCDVAFKTKDGVEVKAHKFFLMDGSPVFKAMFESNMKEAVSGIVFVKDIDGKTMKEVLKLMYSDDPTPIDFMSMKLLKKVLYAAEKYELDWIKSYCGYVLLERCDVETAKSLHKLAKRYRLNQVKEEILRFAKTNFTFEEIWDEITDQLESDSDSESE